MRYERYTIDMWVRHGYTEKHEFPGEYTLLVHPRTLNRVRIYENGTTWHDEKSRNMNIYELEKEATGWDQKTFVGKPPLSVLKKSLLLLGCIPGIGGPTEVASLNAGAANEKARRALESEALLLAHCRNNFMRTLEELKHQVYYHRKWGNDNTADRLVDLIKELEDVK